jgi:hypothetical protein
MDWWMEVWIVGCLMFGWMVEWLDWSMGGWIDEWLDV